MARADDSTKPDSLRRRPLETMTRMASAGSAALAVAGLIGQAARDQTVATALLMFIPLPIVGVAAAALDAALRGRTIPRLRFGAAMVGLVAMTASTLQLTGSAVRARAGPHDDEVGVLQWNVQWGGGLFRSPGTWAAQRRAIVAAAPDLVVLSEAPPGDWLDQLVADLGPGASCVGAHHDPASPYWYRMAVCSRRPMRLDGRWDLPGGTAMSVTAEHPGRPVRLLVVDGISSPTRSRRPFLRAVADLCRRAQAAGRPYQVVLGDFNTPSRSLGFDEFEALDYRLAGRSARGWRGTFPAWLPVYDIDHVWLGAGSRPADALFFNGPSTDHRGQLVRVLLPKEPPP